MGAGPKVARVKKAPPPSEKPSEKRIFTEPRELFKAELAAIQSWESDSSYEVLKYPIVRAEEGVEVTRYIDAVAIPMDAFVKYAEGGQIPGVREHHELPEFFDKRGWRTEVLKEGPFKDQLCAVCILSSSDMLVDGVLHLDKGKIMSYAEFQERYEEAPPIKKGKEYAPERVAGKKKLVGEKRFAKEAPKPKKTK